MDTHFRDIVSSRYQTARTRIVNKSIPQRMSVILFCMFGSIIINGIVASLNRMLVATGEIIMEERNVTDEKQEQQARISKKPEELAVLHVSFSIAYMVALIPCGVLADKYGGKVFCLGGMIVAAIVCFFLPLIATYFSWILFCSFMMILGVTQAFIRLGEAVLITRWTPISERACFGGFVFGARPVGHGLGHMLSWMAIHYKQYWFLVYLFWGTVGILWSVLYLLSVYEEPKKNPFISIKEKEIIEHEVPPRNLHKMPPWKQIVTCRGVWALIVGQMGHTATMFIIMLPLLSYTWWFHKLDPSYRGYKDMATELDCLILLFTCVGLWLVSVSTGIIIDHAVCNSMLHLRASRIIPTCMGFALPVTFLGIMALVPHNWYLTKICFVLAVLTKGFHFASFNVNYMDISINFCGTIVSSMLLPGEMVTCAIILWIVKSELLDWHVLVGTLLACSVFLMSHCVFLMIFFRQKWDYSENDELDRRQRLVTFNKYVNSEELLLSYGTLETMIPIGNSRTAPF
ncbi:hypothetical protein Trydic_g22167 [Trypoxylus dichotomus]